VSHKIDLFYFHDNFAKSGPIKKMTVKFRKGFVDEAWIKTITSPQICYRTTFAKNEFSYAALHLY